MAAMSERKYYSASSFAMKSRISDAQKENVDLKGLIKRRFLDLHVQK
jgi:hypothetical protein